MKSVVRYFLVGVSSLVVSLVQAQKIDEARMERDIEVAENVLGTLMRQQFGKRNFFPIDVEGSYQPGYGVTFRFPNEGQMVFSLGGPGTVWSVQPPMAVGGTVQITGTPEPVIAITPFETDCDDCEKQKEKEKEKGDKNKEKNKTKGYRYEYKQDYNYSDEDRSSDARAGRINNDSARNAANLRMIEASKDFIADYGDMISQLTPEEKIVITNRNEGNRSWYNGNQSKRRMISLEARRGDITDFKQGKLTRAQMMAKITVVNSETSEELTPDLELFSSIFNRLYRSDLSKTYYMQDNLYYERLKDYGAIYYMQVYSSNENDYGKYSMPTLGLENIDKATRNKKVIELYPLFEKDVKESLVEYGRTVKSLKDTEVLVLNVKLTKCAQCGIPSTSEFSVKTSVLRDYAMGKITRDAATAQVAVKKGPAQ